MDLTDLMLRKQLNPKGSRMDYFIYLKHHIKLNPIVQGKIVVNLIELEIDPEEKVKQLSLEDWQVPVIMVVALCETWRKISCALFCRHFIT